MHFALLPALVAVNPISLAEGCSSQRQKPAAGQADRPALGRGGQGPSHSGVGLLCSAHGPKEFVYSAGFPDRSQGELKHQNPIFCHLVKF